MAKRRKPPTLRELEDALDDDLLFGPIEHAHEELREAGLDPDAIAKRGVTLGKSLTWRTLARKQLHRVQELEVKRTVLPRDRTVLLAHIEKARANPRFDAQMQVAFRDRRPETADVDELIGLLEDIGFLEQLEDEDL